MSNLGRRIGRLEKSATAGQGCPGCGNGGDGKLKKIVMVVAEGTIGKPPPRRCDVCGRELDYTLMIEATLVRPVSWPEKPYRVLEQVEIETDVELP